MPELMAGISVIAILAGTGATNAVKQINQAKITATMDEMKSISLAVTEYQKDNPGETISSINTLVTQYYLTQGFVEAPNSELKTDWTEDTWGTDYKLTPPSIETDGDFIRGSLESAGPDGKLTDDTATPYNEADDNIKITLEPMVGGTD